MVEGFFLDRVDTKAARATIGGENDRVVLPHADETQAALALAQAAEAGAQIALDALVVEDVPETGRDGI